MHGMAGKIRFTFSILLIPHGESSWSAQCLEYDIAAQGSSAREAIRRFQRTVEDQIAIDGAHGRKPLEGVGRAPAVFFEAWESALPLCDAPEGTIADVVAAEHLRVADTAIAA